MENYDLEENEVVLYKGKVLFPNTKGTTEIILTNINFVLITKQKKIFAKEQVVVDTYAVNEIKYYNNQPQVIKKGNLIELYFLDDEIEFEFEARNEARKFVNATLNLLTNKTAFERNAEKVKNTISVIDNTLGIDTRGMTANVIKNGIVGQASNMFGKGVTAISKIIKKK